MGHRLCRPAAPGPIRAGVFIFFIFIFAAVFVPAIADGAPIVVEALTDDTETRADLRTGFMRADGLVRVTYLDLQATAGAMWYDPDASRFVMAGDVLVSQGDLEFSGSQFIYDLNEGVGQLLSPEGVFSVKTATEPVYVKGSALTTTNEFVEVADARFTTCGCLPEGDPGYYVGARKIIVYPGERLVLKGARFVESGMTLFYWPSLTIPLDSEFVNNVELPQVGYSSDDGWFVRTGYHYYLDSGGAGRIALDWYQLRGVGVGVTHQFWHDRRKEGLASVYHLYNRKTDHHDIDLGTDLTWRPTDNLHVTGKVDWSSRSLAGSELFRLRSSGTVTHQDDLGSVRMNWTLDRSAGAEDKLRNDAVFRFLRRPAPGWEVRLEADRRVDSSRTGLNRALVGYLGQVRYRMSRYSFALRVEDRFHQDLIDNKITPWRTVARLPEATVDVDGLYLLGTRLPVDTSLGIGRFRETPGPVESERYRLELALETQTWYLGGDRRHMLSYTGSVEGMAYGTMDRYLGLHSTTSYLFRPTSQTSLRLRYQYDEGFGQTPFLFDRITTTEVVTATAEYRLNKHLFSLSSGFDWRTQALQDVLGRIRLGIKDVTIDVRTGYSPTHGTWRDVLGMVEWEPESDWSVRLGAIYSPTTASIRRFDADIDLKVSDGWQVSYNAIYDHVAGEFVRGNIGIVRDLDCRLIGLRYDQVKKEIWLDYKITAFPDTKFSLGTGDDQSMLFELDGWEALMP